MKSVNSDIAYDYIRKRILNGEYPQGHPLMTEVLAAEIKVSRTPVRDALRQLEADGLVSIRPRIGASVKAMDLKEYRELCGMRLALESYAAGLAAQYRTDGDLREISVALEAMRELTNQIIASESDEPILADLIREDVRFHIAIIVAAKNDLMKKEILRLHLINRVVSGPNPASSQMPMEKAERDARRRAVLASHEEIYRAIEHRDTAGAKDAMERHLQDLIDHNIRMMTRSRSGPIIRELTEEELSYIA